MNTNYSLVSNALSNVNWSAKCCQVLSQTQVSVQNRFPMAANPALKGSHARKDKVNLVHQKHALIGHVPISLAQTDHDLIDRAMTGRGRIILAAMVHVLHNHLGL